MPDTPAATSPWEAIDHAYHAVVEARSGGVGFRAPAARPLDVLWCWKAAVDVMPESTRSITWPRRALARYRPVTAPLRPRRRHEPRTSLRAWTIAQVAC